MADCWLLLLVKDAEAGSQPAALPRRELVPGSQFGNGCLKQFCSNIVPFMFFPILCPSRNYHFTWEACTLFSCSSPFTEMGCQCFTPSVLHT